MNIFNLKRVQEVNDWEMETNEEEKGSISSSSEEITSTNTSITEARNDKFKRICSEILKDFIYLGSDFLA